MRRLFGWFVVGSTALLCASVIYSSQIFPDWGQPTQIVGGLVLGTLASVVLYALMRTMPRGVRVNIVHIADWPKLRSAIFATGMYAGAALATFGSQTYVRLSLCSEYRACAASIAKGAVWSAIWPVLWTSLGHMPPPKN
jgi:hypothetical protein